MTGYGQFCSMARAHEVLGGRWTLLIVREILSGSRRFNDIRRGIPRVSRTVLSERLQALVFVGAIAPDRWSARPRIPAHRSGAGAGAAGEGTRHMGTALARAGARE